MPVPLIEYRDVTVFHNSHRALDAISLSIDAGEHVAILGPNGSGKSTLIKTITRDCYPHQSYGRPSMRILGRDVWNIFDLLPLLGIVSPDLAFIFTRDLSAREAILSGFFASVGLWRNHRVTPAMENKTREVLELLEIAHLADRAVSEMSSGEARRVLIGRALVHDPKALVLDEPSSSLDLHATAELRRILRRIAQSGVSIILVTHHLPDIIPEIGRVILLKDGRVVADGPKHQVLTAEALSHLFGVEVDLLERNGYYNLW
ncbi:MAG: ABC transporter ATP-binding protein [Bryobacteraceae bacterium]